MTKANLTKLVKYLCVGALAYVVEMAAIFVFHEIYKLSDVVSVAISFWIGFMVAFVLQKLITFQNRDTSAKGLTRQIAGYSLLVAWNYLFTLFVAQLLSTVTLPYVSRTISIMVITIWNFIIYKKIFASRHETTVS